ncbi:MAG: hypothetical protein LBS99_04890 [Clostridiales bacterium]|jgi:hypothetical protein|nr:hypothetical protein [Clostridiales bacterium]
MRVIKKYIFTAVLLIASAGLSACGGSPAGNSPGGDRTALRPTEEERVNSDSVWAAALGLDEEFECNGITMRAVRCDTSVLYPSGGSGYRGIRIYVDYPAGETYASENVNVRDIDRNIYTPSAMDGLDFLGQHRHEPQVADGLGYARFSVRKEYNYVLAEFKSGSEIIFVRLAVADRDAP